MPTDRELLRQYSQQGDEAAFAEVVRRHADLVYSVALRVTCNGALAQDVTQTVFTAVARQAGRLSHCDSLVGWLHTVTRHRSIDAIRGEERRRTREQEATAMQNDSLTPELNWTEIGPLLDEAVGQLRELDREAVLLRFFKNLSHQEVGAALGLGEDAARKRVDRALEKLRGHFARRGVTASSAMLTAAISANSVSAAPVDLVASITAASLAGVGSVTASGAFLVSFFAFFMTTKTKTILATAVVLALVATLAIKLRSPSEQPGSAKVTTTPTTTTTASVAASMPKTPLIQTATQMTATVVKPTTAPAPVSKSSGLAAPDVIASGTLTLSALPENADLMTAIPALIHYLETDDFVRILPFLLTPEEIQQMLQSGKAASVQDLAEKFRAELKNHGGANFLAQALNLIKDQPASIDVTGNKAIYEIDPPIAGHKEITFIKKDGLWYGPQ